MKRVMWYTGLVALLLLFVGFFEAKAQATENPNATGPYAQYDYSTDTLIIQYGSYTPDYQMTIFPIDDDIKYDFSTLPWRGMSNNIEHVKFDKSLQDNNFSPKYLDFWFFNGLQIEDVEGLEYLSTENTLSCERMFAGNEKLKTVTFGSKFLAEKITTMACMFMGCSDLQSVYFPEGFSGKELITTEGMFMADESLELVDYPSSFTCEKVQNMAAMFYNCQKLWAIDMSMASFDKLYDTNLMFANCNTLKYVNLSNFNTKPKLIDGELKAVNTRKMFAQTDFETEKVLGMIPALETITLSNTCQLASEKLPEGNSYFAFDELWTAFNGGEAQQTVQGVDAFYAFQEASLAKGFASTTFELGDHMPEPGPEPGPDPEPTPVDDGWKESEGGWQYFVDGMPAQNLWVWIDDADGAHWYFFGEDTYMKANQWLWDENYGAWYYCSAEGGMAINTWLWDASVSSWYYCNNNGAMDKGSWQWIGDEWYGFDWSGKMCTGWTWDADWQAWYFCANNGVMARSSYVDSYWVNQSGAWVA